MFVGMSANVGEFRETFGVDDVRDGGSFFNRTVAVNVAPGIVTRGLTTREMFGAHPWRSDRQANNQHGVTRPCPNETGCGLLRKVQVHDVQSYVTSCGVVKRPGHGTDNRETK